MELNDYVSVIREEILTEAMYQIALAANHADKRVNAARDAVERAGEVVDSLAQEEEQDFPVPPERGAFQWRLRTALSAYESARAAEEHCRWIQRQLKTEMSAELLQDLQEALCDASQLPFNWLEYMKAHGRPARRFETWA